MNYAEEAARLGGTYTPPSGPDKDIPVVSPELDFAVAAKELGGTYTPPPGDPKEPSLRERLPRQLGLTARAAGRAALTAGGLAEMVGDAIPGLQGRVGPAVDAILNAVGLPEPETPTERVAGRVAGAMGGVRTLANLANAARPTSEAGRALRELLSRRLHTQTVSAGGAAGAGGYVHEQGGTPGQEIAASVAGSLVAPGAAAGRQNVAGRLEPTRNLYTSVGAEPDLGQLTGSRIVQNAQELGMNLPFSRPILETARRRQQADLGRSANEQSAYVAQLGRAPNTQQNAAGNRFSTESFLNQWSRMPNEAAREMAIPDPVVRGHFDRLARVAENIREVRDNTTLARQRGRWSGPLGLVASGFIGGAALPAAILGAAAGSSKLLLTNRNFTRWLADASESQGGDLPRRMQQLRVMTNVERDPDTRAAMDEYMANLVEKLQTPEGAQRSE